jgi:ribosomal protein S1
MKKFVLAAVAVSMIWVGTALAGAAGNVSGEVTKVDGDMVTIKMADGSTKSVHVDPAGTKKEGEIKVGAHVTADVTSGGHANWIKEMKDDHGAMKK